MDTSAAELVDPPLEVSMDVAAWDEALGAYYDEHDEVLLDGDARGPGLFHIEKLSDKWLITQIVHDPAGNHDWQIRAVADLSASDEAGAAVVRALAFHRVDG